MAPPSSPGPHGDVSSLLWMPAGFLSPVCEDKMMPYALAASWVVLVVKNPPASAGDIRDMGLIPGLGRSPGGGHGTQYSCLENPMDRGAW